MKKTIITTFMLIASIVISAQSKKDSVTKAPETYYILGQVSDFNLLLKALQTPDDVTKNEVKALIQWVYGAKPLPKPEAEKPKSETKDKPKQ